MSDLKNIIIASDSFKGCLSSTDVALSIETAVRKVYPESCVKKIPLADGGEGTLETLCQKLEGIEIEVWVHDSLMRPIKANYLISDDGTTAVIEMAVVNGLPLLTLSERNPMSTTSFGLGELILSALQKGCTRFIIGIGGSATCDSGVGMLQALGMRFFDRDNCLLEPGAGGESLSRIVKIEDTQLCSALKQAKFQVACDVDNPLFGLSGAAYVFAPQKGADHGMVLKLEEGLISFARIVGEQGYSCFDSLSGAGAAGGIGFALATFMDASLLPGIDLILEAINFKALIQDADLIITGEGQLDGQTLMGKLPLGVLKVAQTQHIPVIAVCGSLENNENLLDCGFLAVFPVLSEPVSLEKAMNPLYTKQNIERTVSQFLRIIRAF